MNPAEHLEPPLVKALRTQRHSRESRGSIFTEPAPLDSPRVGFHGDFNIGCQRQVPPRRFNHPANGIRREQAGRSTAEKDADDFPCGDLPGLRLQVTLKRFHIAALIKITMQGAENEVEISALAQTPGEVHVEGQWRRWK